MKMGLEDEVNQGLTSQKPACPRKGIISKRVSIGEYDMAEFRCIKCDGYGNYEIAGLKRVCSFYTEENSKLY